MHTLIALFFLELLRAAFGGAWTAASSYWTPAPEQLPLEQELAPEPPALEDPLLNAVPGATIFRGGFYSQEPSGGPVGQNVKGSVLGTEESELPAFLAALQATGVGVLPGEVLSFDPQTNAPKSWGNASAAGAGSTSLPGTRYKLRQYTLVPPTPFLEPFTLMVPSPLPASAAPLLVIFHKFGSSNLDVLQNTDYVRQCAQRGWFLVCPLGGSKKHFGSLESQINTEAVLDWMLANASLRIDRERIYAIGFSMGGGAALNYAARHRDPAHAIIAAMVNHSGNTDLNHTYYHDAPVGFLFDFWFGDGSVGSADAWKMTRSSSLNFDPVTLAIDTASDQVRNLGSTPIRTFQASDDLVPYLPQQNERLDEHMRTNLGRVVGNDYSYTVVPYTGHGWDMVDASDACDWLGQFTLTTPMTGRTLADSDGVFEHFFVQQTTAGAFTSFDWAVMAHTNGLRISATSNLKRLTIDPIASGLSTAGDLTVHMSGAAELALASWPHPPSAVTRDGVPEFGWSYIAPSRDLVLFEADGAPHVWVVTP